MRAPGLRKVASLAVAAAFVTAASSALAGEQWIFSAYTGRPLQRVIIGPFESGDACEAARQGYLQNDSYRDVTPCAQQ